MQVLVEKTCVVIRRKLTVKQSQCTVKQVNATRKRSLEFVARPWQPKLEDLEC